MDSSHHPKVFFTSIRIRITLSAKRDHAVFSKNPYSGNDYSEATFEQSYQEELVDTEFYMIPNLLAKRCRSPIVPTVPKKYQPPGVSHYEANPLL